MVGSHLIFDLLQKGQEIRALKRKSSNIEQVKHVFSYYTEEYEKLFNRIEWVEGDILDIYSLEEAMQGIEYVYNCAGYVSFNPRERNNVIRINEQGTANVVNASLENKVKKLCHISSIAALGRSVDDEWIDENSKWKTSRKNSVYAISKFAAEREVWRGTEEGLNAVIVNPGIILGPANWETGSARLFMGVYTGLNFYTTGVNGFVDVKDVSKAMIMLMESDIINQRYVLNAENISYKELLFTIAEELNVRPPRIKAGPILSGIAWRVEKIRSLTTGYTPFITKETANSANGRYYYSAEKIRKEFGFNFMKIRDCIKDTCACLIKDKRN